MRVVIMVIGIYKSSSEFCVYMLSDYYSDACLSTRLCWCLSYHATRLCGLIIMEILLKINSLNLDSAWQCIS